MGIDRGVLLALLLIVAQRELAKLVVGPRSLRARTPPRMTRSPGLHEVRTSRPSPDLNRPRMIPVPHNRVNLSRPLPESVSPFGAAYPSGALAGVVAQAGWHATQMTMSVTMNNRVQTLSLGNTCTTARWMKWSSTVVAPSRRTPPDAFGICTPRTGCGSSVPSRSRDLVSDQ